MKKLLIALSLATMSTILLFGCFSKNTSESQNEKTNSTDKEQRTITFKTITGFYEDGLKQAAIDYNLLHPETTVKIEFSSDNTAYQTEFQAKMASGGQEAPDIIHLNLSGGESAQEKLNKGWIRDLTDLANRPNPYNNNISIIDNISNKNYVSWMYSSSGQVAMLPFDLVGTGFYYNKKIFNELNLKEPTSWEELFNVLEVLKNANKTPLVVSFTPVADYEGWLNGSFIDWYTKKHYTEVLVMPGEARNSDVVEKLNSSIVYSPDNPNFDSGAIYDDEKVFEKWKDGSIKIESPEQKFIWETLKKLSGYYQSGYKTMSNQDCYQLFISGQSGIMLDGSWKLGALMADMKDLGDSGFEVGVFKFLEFEDPKPIFDGKPRGILAVGHLLSITNRLDEEQKNRAEDFLLYLFSPKVSEMIYEKTLSAGQFVQGPSLVSGVKLRPEYEDALKGFIISGNIGLNPFSIILSGNPSNEPNISTEIKELQIKYYEDKISIDEYLKIKSEMNEKNCQDYVERMGYDFNPTTSE